MALPSALLLRRQLTELQKNPVEGFSAGLISDDDLFRWEIVMMAPEGTLYEGGMFRCELIFPKEYPVLPPTLKFVGVVPYHPNIHDTGEVCISILHPPGDDKWGYEDSGERWLPVHTVTTIMLSVMSMFSDPNDQSPANVAAAKDWRENKDEFKKKVRRCVRLSQES